MRRYRAWRDIPSACAARLTTPWAAASAASTAARLGSSRLRDAPCADCVAAGSLEQVGADRLPAGEQRRALDHVLELAHVARPRVCAQRVPRALAQRRAPGEEMLGQRQDVVAAFGQRRQAHLDHVEAVVQVLAEQAVAHHGLQVGVGRAQHAHLHVARLVGAQALEAAGVEHPQQLHLAAQRKVADLVEEQGAAIGRFEAPRARLGGAGEGAALGAEQLGLDQLAGQRAAVHRHERAARDGRVRMHDGRDALLAAAVGPGDEHRHVGARDLAGQLQRAQRGVGLEHQVAEREARGERRLAVASLLAHAAHLGAGLGQLEQVLDGGQQLGVVPGLGEVVGRAGLDQLDRVLQPRPRGQQHDGHVDVAGTDGPEQRDALLARRGVGAEVHVLDHHVHAFALQQRQSLRGAEGHQRADVAQRQRERQRLADARVVVDDQDGRHGPSGSRPGPAIRGPAAPSTPASTGNDWPASRAWSCAGDRPPRRPAWPCPHRHRRRPWPPSRG